MTPSRRRDRVPEILQSSRNPATLNTPYPAIFTFKSLYPYVRILDRIFLPSTLACRLTGISGSLPKYRLNAVERATAADAEYKFADELALGRTGLRSSWDRTEPLLRFRMLKRTSCTCSAQLGKSRSQSPVVLRPRAARPGRNADARASLDGAKSWQGKPMWLP